MTGADGANRAPHAGACQELPLWLEELRTTTATKNDTVAVANTRCHIDLVRIATYIAELLIMVGYLAVLATKVTSGYGQNAFQGARPALARTDPDG
jgi:hypothetical protein